MSIKALNVKNPEFRKKAGRQLTSFALTVLGSALYAVGFRFFLYPNDIVSGGITGIAMIINYVTSWPIGVMVLIMNVPLFLIAWRRLGTEFMVWSLIGTAVSSVLVDVLAAWPVTVTSDLTLACVFGGVIKGIGWGIVYRAGATGGGIDIVAKLMRQKYPYINFGTFILILDVVVVAAFALFFRKWEQAMYSVIAIYISTKAIDLVLYGSVSTKLCYIITDNSKAMSDAITEQLHRGVTYLHGEGAYTGKGKEVILCVIKRQQIVTLRRIVRETDASAFIVISDARDVFGKGFASIMDNS